MTSDLPVVVGVDPSDSARHAALWAADLAATRGGRLELVHASSSRPGPLPDWLRELVDAAARAGAPAVAEVVRGAAFDVLLTRSHRAAMTVVGSFGRDAPAGLLVGSTALTLVARAGSPVAVVRGRGEGLAPPRGGPVLVGLDGTPASDPALVLAAELGAALGAAVQALHSTFDPAGAADVDDQLARVGVPVECRPVVGPPLRALLKSAAAARAVVVAQRGHVPPGGMHLGSTSRGLVGLAPCPVVVARTGVRQARAAAARTGAGRGGTRNGEWGE